MHPLIATVGRGGPRFRLFTSDSSDRWRPIIRGTVSCDSDERRALSREVQSDGLVEYSFMYRRENEQREEPFYLPIERVMGLFGNGLCSVERFRRTAGAPDVEYGLEFEVTNPGSDLSVCTYAGNTWWSQVGSLPQGSTVFPRYSIGPAGEFQQLSQAFERDFWNAAGIDPPDVGLVDFDRAFRELEIVADSGS